MRLHGPWRFEPLARTVVHPDGRIEPTSGPLPASGRMKVPCNLQGSVLDGFRGRVRWRRAFHGPRSLEPDEQLWLVFEGVDYFADVSLNNTRLGHHQGYFEPFVFDVTDQVRPKNELIVEVDCPAESDLTHKRLIRGSVEARYPGLAGGLWQAVAIEVRSVASLRDVKMLATLTDSLGTLLVTGKVAGQTGIGLALDLNLDGVRTARQKIEATPKGTDFRFETRVDPVQPWWPRNLGQPKTYGVQLELHGKARTMDQVTRTLGFRQLVLDPDLRSAKLNGRRFPVVPYDLQTTPQEGLEGLLDSMPREQDSLLIASFGGVVLGPAEYDQLDSLGLLVRQDFPLCGGYSVDEAFRAEAVCQAAAMVRQLAAHPSIVIWSCHLDAAGHDLELDRALQATIATMDPTRPCLLGTLPFDE